MVVLDEITERGTQFGIGKALQESLNAPEWLGGIVLSTLAILIGVGVLVGLVKSIFKPTTRELIIALYTGFFVTYWVLGFIGTSFRGPGQELMWPWDLPLVHH
jgi:uncharacterized transporter YbjL